MTQRIKNVGVFFGSSSPEHDVSIITGQLIISTLKKLGYGVVPVYITKQGQWLIGEELGSIKSFIAKNFDDASEGGRYKKYFLDLEASKSKMVFRKKGLMEKTVVVDIAFPALHGSYGEDGTIQGLFEMLRVPYVGCDVPSSAVAMDKALTKQVVQSHGIPTTKFTVFNKQDWESDRAKILNRITEQLRWPVFVKPVHLGSSIGIAKVKERSEKDLEFRIEVALRYDDKVLVEEGVENLMDVTCCVLGNDDLKASLLQESVFSSDLFDFEEKYLKEGGSQLGKSKSGVVIPARLDEGTTRKIQALASEVYKALGCGGIARVDFLFNKQTKEIYANEVNPLPGTLYHHLWKASGMELEDLVNELVRLAEEKAEKKKQFTYTFESNILKQLNGSKIGSSKLS